MSLIGALNIGKSALMVQQAAIQVTGNNIANAGNANYTRQVGTITPGQDQQLSPGIFMGTGIDLSSIQRQIDEALEGRLRSSISDNSSASTMQEWMNRVESVFNALGDSNLSTRMTDFFSSWSKLANNPQDAGLRQVVIQNGQSVASWMQTIRQDLSDLQSAADQQLAGLTTNANAMAQQIADLNGKIVVAEGSTGGQANGLRDQRDAVLKQLADLMDVQTSPGAQGMVNVYVGSEPLVVGTNNRGVALKQEVVNGQLTTSVISKTDNGVMQIKGGQIGALTSIRTQQTQDAIDQLDGLAKNLIFEVNKIYSSGQGLQGFSTVSSTNGVDNPDAALNTSASGLAFTPVNGSFVVHVTNKTTGLTTSTLIPVDLDGLNGPDTTLTSLKDKLNTELQPNVTASIQGGKLSLNAASDTEISFSQDSSGVLATLGINSFFTGTTAHDIAVNQTVISSPGLLAVSKNGEPTDNQTALALAAMDSNPLSGLGGLSLNDSYAKMISQLAVASGSAKTNAEASQTVKETLESQRESLSGVSLDEEAVNLMRQQRAFQGASKLISVVDQMMQTLLQMG